jgi:PEGA domain
LIRNVVLFALIVIGFGNSSIAQNPDAPTAEKPRVFVTDSNSWQMTGGAGGANGAFAASQAGGARPQTAEIIKTFGERCPQVIVNNHPDASAYVVQLEHEGGKGLLAHKDKVAVFVRKSGDSIFSKSTLSVGGSVQDSCAAILAHWANYSKEYAVVPPTAAAVATPAVLAAAAEKPKLNITSTPAGADIEINGSFVGNTPSTIEVDLGDQDISISKKGFAPWTRKLKVKGGTITLNADLDTAGK